MKNQESKEKKAWMKRVRDRDLMKDTKGLNTVEYAILLVLIVVVSYGLWDTFGKKIEGGVKKANDTVKIDKK